MPNPFNPLNGAELRVLCCKDIGRELDRDARFGFDPEYRSASYALEIRVATTPEDQGFTCVLSGAVGKGNGAKVKLAIVEHINHQLSMDDRFRINIGYPKLSISSALTVNTVFSDESQVPVDRGETERPGQHAVPPTAPTPTAPKAKDPGSFAVANTTGEHVPAEEWGAEDRSDMRPVQRPSNVTSSGLPLEGGAMELPPSVIATQQAHREANKELLETNRVIENPNEARRSVGMHVPVPTAVGKGLIADIPAGADKDLF